MNEQNQESKPHISEEEPQLFEEKQGDRARLKRRLVIFAALAVAVFLLWPRGLVKGEALLQAGKFAKIGLTSSGVLKDLLREKGAALKEGELIARFENRELLKLYAQQTILLEKLKEQKKLFQEKEAFQKKETERYQILHENSVIGRTLLEKSRLDSFQISQELVMLEKEIGSNAEEFEYLKSRVESLELKAPFDGVLLTDPSDHMGSPIREGEFVLEIADPDTYFLEILIPEKEVEKITIGNRVTARFHAFPWKTYPGEVTKIAPRTTEEIEKVFKIRRVIPCEIKLTSLPRNIKYGMQAAVKIRTKRKGFFR